MLDKEMHIRFTLRALLRSDLFGPAVAVGLFVIFAFVVFARWDTASVAAWVQAVGSVGAILVAVYIATEQRRAETAELRNKEAVILLVTGERASEATARLRTMNYTLMNHFRPITDTSAPDVQMALKSLDEGLSSIKSIDLIGLPNPVVVEAVIKLRAVLEYARHAAVVGRSPGLAVGGKEIDGPLIFLVREAESCVSAIRSGR